MEILLENGRNLKIDEIAKAVWDPNSAGDGFFVQSHVLKLYLENDKLIVLKGTEAETIYDDYIVRNSDINVKKKGLRASRHITPFP